MPSSVELKLSGPLAKLWRLLESTGLSEKVRLDKHPYDPIYRLWANMDWLPFNSETGYYHTRNYSDFDFLIFVLNGLRLSHVTFFPFAKRETRIVRFDVGNTKYTATFYDQEWNHTDHRDVQHGNADQGSTFNTPG